MAYTLKERTSLKSTEDDLCIFFVVIEMNSFSLRRIHKLAANEVKHTRHSRDGNTMIYECGICAKQELLRRRINVNSR